MKVKNSELVLITMHFNYDATLYSYKTNDHTCRSQVYITTVLGIEDEKLQLFQMDTAPLW
jgi:hypothetical protein